MKQSRVISYVVLLIAPENNSEIHLAPGSASFLSMRSIIDRMLVDSRRTSCSTLAVGFVLDHWNTIVANDNTPEVCMEAEATPVLQLLLLIQVSIVQSNIICINLQGSRLQLCGPRAQHLEGNRR
jgi:hypothetical protein